MLQLRCSYVAVTLQSSSNRTEAGKILAPFDAKYEQYVNENTRTNYRSDIQESRFKNNEWEVLGKRLPKILKYSLL